MALRVGTDITTVSRMERICASPWGRRFVFTDAELARCSPEPTSRDVEYLAGRFSAKESVAKVLGRGLGQGLSWRDIEILRDAHGRPEVVLHRGARAIAADLGIDSVDVSISHAQDRATSVAAALGAAT